MWIQSGSTPPDEGHVELTLLFIVKISARNQLRGTVKSVNKYGIMAEVVVDIGGQEIVSTITRASAERLSLRAGDAVVAIIKASEVMIGK